MSAQLLEDALVARLTERVKEQADLVSYVYPAGEYALVAEDSQLTPALAVIYNGYEAGEAIGQGSLQLVEFQFLVIIVTRSAVDFAHGGGAREESSAIFDAVLAATLGWRPTGIAGTYPGPFRLAAAPGSQVSAQGFVYQPIALTIQRRFSGT